MSEFALELDGGAQNARQTWSLQKRSGSEPYQGFHRAPSPEALGNSMPGSETPRT